MCRQGRGYTIGGEHPTEAAKDAALAHMTPWVSLCKDTIAAEFPEVSMTMAFAAFKLSKQRSAGHSVSDATIVRLRRLQQTFRKPGLLREFKEHLPHAQIAYADKACIDNYWDAWADAIATLRRMRRCSQKSEDLEYVVQRGKCLVNVTSGVEQSFARVCQKLGPQRLHASDTQEEQTVNILLADLTGSELEELTHESRNIYMAATSTHSRTHRAIRADAGVKKDPAPLPDIGAAPCGKMTEKGFLRRMCAQVKRLAPSGGSQRTIAAGVWGSTHDDERAFQNAKRCKRLVEAHEENLILPNEQTPDLLAAVEAAGKGKLASRKQREAAQSRLAARVMGEGPSTGELRRAAVFSDAGVALPLDALVRHEARQVATPWQALVFICDNPWQPRDERIPVAAGLLGAWALVPNALVCAGAAVKYKGALSTKRLVWASEGFRAEHARIWHTILECMNSRRHAWSILPTAAEYAVAKVKANNAPATVWALVTDVEKALNPLKHVYSASEFIDAICVVDKRTFG